VFRFRSVSLHYTNAGVNPDDFKASILFKALEAAMQTDEDNLIERVRGVYAFKVRNGPNGKEGYWIVNAKTGKGSVEFNGKGMLYLSFYYSNLMFECLSGWGGFFFICVYIMYVYLFYSVYFIYFYLLLLLFIYLFIVEYSLSFHIIFKTLDVHNCHDYIETLVSLQWLVMRILL
jgi:hypothetical protein